MFPRVTLSALLMFCLLQQGCLFHHKKKPVTVRAAYPPMPIPVGTVSLVNQEGEFVLVDNESFPVPPVGGTLKCYSGGSQVATAELVATNVARRPFTIADIRKGSPHKGDRVVYLPPELRKPAALEERAASAPPVQPSTAGPVLQ